MHPALTAGLKGILASVALAGLCACERETRDFRSPPPSDSSAAERVERNAYQVAQGKQLFQWMNCSGCHAHGGGGIGPALGDSKWLYGGSLRQIYLSIKEGRPNGMPAWGSKLTEQQIWQLAAYIRSMGRYISKDVAPSRDDAMQSGKAESRRPKQSPPLERTPE